MEMEHDGVKIHCLPDSAKCCLDKEKRCPLDMDSCTMGYDKCTGDCEYYIE